ncbi:hypothetical protein KDW20_29375 [Burkholderia cenocepacia]|uniref:hypothetical protein n=1 Tax=Burkholderia cenocepacia TaxID=95486 RepID=UPI001B9F7730|nr:hypothetical protein [Burkholderia cenocepacia]MBR8379894.1 hypothetical protein [Burkholderia cenocepacia]
MGVQMLGAVLAALEPDTPTLRPLFGKAVPDVASRRLDAPREDQSMARSHRRSRFSGDLMA